jgi:predicted transcriptional regulator
VTAYEGRAGLIYGIIQQFPGLYFREITRAASLSVGVADHHLWRLRKDAAVVAECIWGKKRYFTAQLPAFERRIIGLLREETVRGIVSALRAGAASHSELGRATGISNSTVAWYLGRLRREGMITGRYTLTDPALVDETLSRYRETFSDRLLNSFIAMWQS